VLIRGVLLALTQLKVINSTPGSTRGQLGALGALLAVGWHLTLCPALLRMRCAACTVQLCQRGRLVEVLHHFEFESFLNSLEPKVRTIVKDRAVIAISRRRSMQLAWRTG
jgi:hypothetical protein